MVEGVKVGVGYRRSESRSGLVGSGIHRTSSHP